METSALTSKARGKDRIRLVSFALDRLTPVVARSTMYSSLQTHEGAFAPPKGPDRLIKRASI
jgi:hypothetical protein